MSQVGRKAASPPEEGRPHPRRPGTFDSWLDSGSDAAGTTAPRDRNNNRDRNRNRINNRGS
ncbi:hypothetical protein, partial [Streptomyces sp. SID335]|uniref:hypothetical protein n=1 Tax=Streptomyces sp. SID335 TaxID=2690261 RepID=UPI001F30D873